MREIARMFGVPAYKRGSSPSAQWERNRPRRRLTQLRIASSKVEPRVSIVIDDVLSDPLLREQLREDPALVDLGILRFANATVHEVKPEEDERLRELLGEAKGV